MNTRTRKDVEDGVRGVTRRKNKWLVKLGNKYLGLFQREREAIDARRKAEQEKFGDFVAGEAIPRTERSI
jgi:hypothetical protein